MVNGDNTLAVSLKSKLFDVQTHNSCVDEVIGSIDPRNVNGSDTDTRIAVDNDCVCDTGADGILPLLPDDDDDDDDDTVIGFNDTDGTYDDVVTTVTDDIDVRVSFEMVNTNINESVLVNVDCNITGN